MPQSNVAKELRMLCSQIKDLRKENVVHTFENKGEQMPKRKMNTILTSGVNAVKLNPKTKKSKQTLIQR